MTTSNPFLTFDRATRMKYFTRKDSYVPEIVTHVISLFAVFLTGTSVECTTDAYLPHDDYLPISCPNLYL